MRVIYDPFGVSSLVYGGRLPDGVGDDSTLTEREGGVRHVDGWINPASWIVFICAGACSVGRRAGSWAWIGLVGPGKLVGGGIWYELHEKREKQKQNGRQLMNTPFHMFAIAIPYCGSSFPAHESARMALFAFVVRT